MEEEEKEEKEEDVPVEICARASMHTHTVAVELRKDQLAVLLVLGSCGVGWLPGACSRGLASGGALSSGP